MPHERVFRLYNPVVLVREVEEPTGNTTLLQDIEKSQALGDGETEVEVAVDNKHGGDPFKDLLGSGGIEAFIVVTGFPEGSVELGSMALVICCTDSKGKGV